MSFKYRKIIQPFNNMGKYIVKLKFIVENDYLYNDELYPFHKINLLCLGEYFDNSNKVNLKTNSINIIVKYYILYLYIFL